VTPRRAETSPRDPQQIIEEQGGEIGLRVDREPSRARSRTRGCVISSGRMAPTLRVVLDTCALKLATFPADNNASALIYELARSGLIEALG
jgi:hypothetical protein